MQLWGANIQRLGIERLGKAINDFSRLEKLALVSALDIRGRDKWHGFHRIDGIMTFHPYHNINPFAHMRVCLKKSGSIKLKLPYSQQLSKIASLRWLRISMRLTIVLNKPTGSDFHAQKTSSGFEFLPELRKTHDCQRYQRANARIRRAG